jgi:hypothetical protein
MYHTPGFFMFPVHALGDVFGGPLATRHTRVGAAWSQSLKKMIFGGSILARAGLAPASAAGEKGRTRVCKG